MTVLSKSPQIIVDGLKTQKGKIMEKREEARKELTKMYEGILIGFRCTCLIGSQAKEVLRKNINNILKNAVGEELATERDFEGCLDSSAYWEKRIEKWLK